MASFRKRGDRWQARVSRKGMVSEVKSFVLREDAEKWARSIEREMDIGNYTSRSKAEGTTLGEVLKKYREEVTPLHRGSSVEALRLKAMESHKIARLSLAALNAQAVASYRDARLRTVRGPAKKPISDSTVLRELQILSAVLNHARLEWCYPIANPVADIRKPSAGRGRDRVLSADEEVTLLAHLDGGGRRDDGTFDAGTRNPWVSPLVRVALETAMRRGELLALQWKHVDLVKRVAFLPMTKNGDTRSVPLSGKAVAVLQSLSRSGDDVVFPLSPDALKLAFVRAVKACKLVDLHFHDLRHTATSRLAEKLPNIIELSRVTGHKDVRMLSRYYHVTAEALALKIA
jgi:integrase